MLCLLTELLKYRYRNYMMACTALYEQQVMPQYFALLAQDDGGPGIRNLQELIEQAWSEGLGYPVHTSQN
jgi:hypothetical protein